MTTATRNQPLEDRVQRLRADEPGRGRDARSITQIPLSGWRDILLRVWEEIGRDRVGLTAAGVTFYVVLAMFPAMVLIISLYGLITDAAALNEHLSLLEGVAPPTAIEMIGAELERISAIQSNELGVAVLVAAVFALWSANGAMKALFMAMNVAYGEAETRGFIARTGLTLGFTVAGIVLLVAVLNAIVLVPVVFDYVGVSVLGRFVGAVLPSILLVLLLLAAVTALYRFGASRRRPRWRWVSVGAVGATLLVIAASAAFSFYLSRWGTYGATYGSLGTAIALMMWIYLTTFIVVAGAELNAEIEHQTAQDTTVGSDLPMGERDAYVADTVGEIP